MGVHDAPGVYHSEISSGIKPIHALSTSNVFIPVHSDFGIPGQVLEVTSEDQFDKFFGYYRIDSFSRYVIHGLTLNGCKHIHSLRVVGDNVKYARGAEDTKIGGATPPDGDVVAEGDTLTDEDANFVTVEKVVPGDLLVIDSGDNAGVYVIDEVTDDTHVKTEGTFAATGTVNYSIQGTDDSYGHIAVKSKHPGVRSDNLQVIVSLERTGTTVRVSTSLVESGVNTLLEAITGLKPGTDDAGFVDTQILDKSQWIEIDIDIPVERVTGADGVATGAKTFASAGSTFKTNDVTVGDLLVITSGDAIGVYTITAISSEIEIEVDRTITAGTDLDFSVQGKDKDGAALLALLGTGLETIDLTGGKDDTPLKDDYETALQTFNDIELIGTLIIPDAPIVIDSEGADATKALNSAAIDYCEVKKYWT